jgi:hypothetical protein
MRIRLSSGLYRLERDSSGGSGQFKISSGRISKPKPPTPPIVDCSVNSYVENDYICDYFENESTPPVVDCSINLFVNNDYICDYFV